MVDAINRIAADWAGVAVFLAGTFVLTAAAVACFPGAADAPEPPLRARARGALLVAGHAVKAVGELCATAVDAKRAAGDVTGAVAIAQACAPPTTVARLAFLAAEDALDAADDARAGCASRTAVRALGEAVAAARAAKAKLPAVVDDGVALGATLARLLPCAIEGGAS